MTDSYEDDFGLEDLGIPEGARRSNIS